MSEKSVVHLLKVAMFTVDDVWCEEAPTPDASSLRKDCTCLACLLACAEYGSEARHRYEVLRESGAKP